MKGTASIFAACAAALLTNAAFAADSTDRTTMPQRCAERDANCVMPDGPPHRRGDPERNIAPPATKGSSSTTGSGGVFVLGGDKAKKGAEAGDAGGLKR